MANVITIGRLLLLFVVIGMILEGGVRTITWCIPLIVVVFALDGVDGYVARKRNESTVFGAVFDIAGDRIVENALWVTFAYTQLIPIWVPFLVLSRGFLVDALRSLSLTEGKTPFGKENMMRSPLSEWLTAGRFMRSLYGYAKTFAFIFLTGLEGYLHHDAAGTLLGTIYQERWLRGIGWALVWGAVTLTVVRGLPVIVDAFALWGKPQAVSATNAESKDHS